MAKNKSILVITMTQLNYILAILVELAFKIIDYKPF